KTFHAVKDSDAAWSEPHHSNGLSCSQVVVPLTDNGRLELTNLKMFTFASAQRPEFASDQEFETCKADIPSPPGRNWTSVIISACLAVLVLVAVVAYVISRARQHKYAPASSE
ncbi:LAMP family protein lmp-1 precursor, partial [Aphelenchoides avenae]